MIVLTATVGLISCGKDKDSGRRATTTDRTEITEAAEDTESTEGTETAESSEATVDPGDSGPATPGSNVDSEFCNTAAEAETAGDKVNQAFASQDPAEVESAVTAALAAAEATLELAPADVADTMATNIAFQQKFATLLADYEWDATAAFASPEGVAIRAEAEAVEPELDVIRQYLETECGIVDDSDEVELALPDGDAGLRQLIQFYALGTGVEVTPEQEDCFVAELSGKVDSAQLEALLQGQPDQQVQAAIGTAALACEIQVAVPTG